MRVKMSKQPPPAPTASAVGPCPTLFQTSRTPLHWKFTQNHRTTRPQSDNERLCTVEKNFGLCESVLGQLDQQASAQPTELPRLQKHLLDLEKVILIYHYSVRRADHKVYVCKILKMFCPIYFCREFKGKRTDSVDPDEAAHCVPPHLDLCCLQIQLICFGGFKGKYCP